MAHKTDSIETFYDALAPSYDAMTRFPARFAAERPAFEALVKREGIRTAVDAGCGTGFHGILLAMLGVDVTAVDCSEEMVAAAAANARTAKVDLVVIRSTFESLRKNIDTPQDALFCLGNALAHIASPGELIRSLRGFHEVLGGGGIFVVQVLNFDRILHDGVRIQSITDAGPDTFVRFYDLHPEHILFNILHIHRDEAGVHHDLRSVPLTPLTSGSLEAALREAGFEEVELMSSVAGAAFLPLTSRDLVICARRRIPGKT